jgi:lipopolysaccharide transport system permease protein
MIESKVTVYTPESSLAHPARMLRDMVRDLRASRELSWRLALRDIRAQYRQTLLGFLWVLIFPAANTATWVFLGTTGVISFGHTTLPYPAFVFIGTMLWAILTDAVNAPLQGAVAAQGMLTRINFPREAIVLSGLYQTLFNAAIKLLLLLLLLPLFGVPHGWSLLLVPLGIASIVLVGTALGLLVTPLGLLYSDVGKGLPILMQFMMYLTPVIFEAPRSGIAATAIALNPLAPIITTTRAWLGGTTPESLAYFLGVNAFALLLLVVVWAVYRLAMPILIERMSA